MKTIERPRCIGCEFAQLATWPFMFCVLRQKHVTRTHKCKYAVNRRSQSRL